MQVIHGTAQYQLAKLGKMALREVTALYQYYHYHYHS